jgi:glucosamine 6-phosphate synthetase-like amidotransferase/phosphosugar isomerase protein
MCGIAGSMNKDKAFKLYQDNLTRGYYSSGSFIIDDAKSTSCKKTLGVFSEAVDVPTVPGISLEGVYYLYHSRGPTVETKGFVPDNNHPFRYKDWVIAHNGIISNFHELGKEYFPEEDFTYKTDSCIIPRLLAIKPMKDALELLKGTFALWMWSPYTPGVFICRSGCTLFANFENGDFCSTEFEGSQSIEEGYIYKIENYNKLYKSVPFRYNSPYFVL